MVFWRIVDNQLHPVQETDNLGFEKSEGLRIPDEYLDKQEFMVMRTAHGIGDWGIISAMPRLLKEKYPDCKVYVPSKKLLKKLYGQDHINNVHVVLSIEKLVQKAEATMHLNGTEIFANAESTDMYAAIDALADKLDRQIKKYKEKITDHHKKI